MVIVDDENNGLLNAHKMPVGCYSYLCRANGAAKCRFETLKLAAADLGLRFNLRRLIKPKTAVAK
jgi:hypothetical protein